MLGTVIWCWSHVNYFCLLFRSFFLSFLFSSMATPFFQYSVCRNLNAIDNITVSFNAESIWAGNTSKHQKKKIYYIASYTDELKINRILSWEWVPMTISQIKCSRPFQPGCFCAYIFFLIPNTTIFFLSQRGTVSFLTL